MRAEAILASVNLRSLEVRQFFVLSFHRSLVDHGAVQRHEMLQRLRRARHGSEKRRHVPKGLREAVENRLYSGGRFLLGERIDDVLGSCCC